MKKILFLLGPNLNMVGIRDRHVYGTETAESIQQEVCKKAESLGLELEVFQSNHEGALVDALQQAQMDGVDFIILNAAAYTHYSIAIRDAIAAIQVPVIEVHISNVHTREEFRHNSVIAPVVMGQILGFGIDSYYAAMAVALKKIKGKS